MSDIAPPAPPADDPLALAPLFAGGGEPWLPVLKPVIERQPGAVAFIGPARGPQIVPVRELTFQALKPNPPHRWRVVVFGQNPYPRAASATGIAMFDNAFGDWNASHFGKTPSIRCLIKAAAIGKHDIPRDTPVAGLRKLLADRNVVRPPEWFQAMLAQGVLLLNASLTASADGGLATDRHTAFWRPVVEAVVEEILRAKAAATDADRGVVFAWWGTHAAGLKPLVDRLRLKYPGVRVRHVQHCNPAAQGDLFCRGDHFADVNAAVEAVGGAPVDWLPAVGWDAAQTAAGSGDDVGRMGAFIASTMELHKEYLERLEAVKDEDLADLPPLTGVLDGPVLPFADAVAPVSALLSGLEPVVKQSAAFGRQKAASGAAGRLSADEAAAVYLYTTASAFYRQLNIALRSPDRGRVSPYTAYLRLLFAAVGKLDGRREPLWRGVALDMRRQYPVGRVVTWWGVSSCTSKAAVAQGFMGGRGPRTLFEVTPARAVGIRHLSAFAGEEEYILPPGTRLTVTAVATDRGGLTTVRLTEAAGIGLVA